MALALCIVLGLQGRERERQVGLSTGAGHKSGTKRIRKEHANSEQGTGGDRAVEMGLKPVGSPFLWIYFIMFLLGWGLCPVITGAWNYLWDRLTHV